MLFGAGYVIRAWILFESSIPAPSARVVAAVPVPIAPKVLEPIAVEAPPPPPPPVPATFSMKVGEGPSLELSGSLPPGDLVVRLRERIDEAAPDLIEVNDRIQTDSSVPTPNWLADLPDFAAQLVGSVQQPTLKVGEAKAEIGGSSDDKLALTRLRNRFESLFSAVPSREESLDFDKAKPAPETRMPLVFYLGPEQSRYLVAASVPTTALRESLGEAMEKAVGAEHFTNRIRVSAGTVEESWMSDLVGLIPALLGEKNGAMELIIVDRGIELKGDLPDEAARDSLLALLASAKEAGYRITDNLRVKGQP